MRFIKERNDQDQALLCYILSKNFQKILENLAFRTEKYIRGSIEHQAFLIRTLEKLTALRIITRDSQPSPIVDRFVFEVSKLLHQYGRDTTILNIMTINNCSSFECLMLRDRILGSNDELAQKY